MLSIIRRGCLAAATCMAAAAPLLTPLPADAQVATANARVAMQGTLDHPNERVIFTGQLNIETRLIQDAVFRNPDVLELAIDFSPVRGIGQGTKGPYGTGAFVIVHRPLKAFDEFEVTFPYAPGNNPNAARTGVVAHVVASGASRTWRRSTAPTAAPRASRGCAATTGAP